VRRSLRALRAVVIVAVAMMTLSGAAARPARVRLGIASVRLPNYPVVAGSRVQPILEGAVPPALFLALDGAPTSEILSIPPFRRPQRIVVLGADAAAIGAGILRVVPPPPAGRALLAVACYRDGIAFYDPRTFARLGVLTEDAAPSDIAFATNGDLVFPDTDGSSAFIVGRAPWTVASIDDVPLGEEVAYDPAIGAFFVTRRNGGTGGGLTRIAENGSIVSASVQGTAEGIAVDAHRNIIYVGIVDRGEIERFDARTLHPLGRFRAVPRVFGLALSPTGTTLYAVANISENDGRATGYAAAFDVAGVEPMRIARSRPLPFPVGIALDARRDRLFVTEEGTRAVDVLDAHTLQPLRPPLRTCAIPWKPFVDERAGRLYVPCAGADRVDAFDLTTLRRLRGAPFRTAGYPLAAAAWYPRDAR
jgi:DNA-binding beta-propeller fold protein YncE